jgi:NUMOD4 motif.
METWLPVKDFNDYEVSNYGRVRSLKTNTIMKSYTTKNGYQQIKLFSKSKHHPRYIHRLVAAAFLIVIMKNLKSIISMEIKKTIL